MFDKSLEFFANVGEALAVAAGQLIPKIPQIISGLIKTLTSKENIQRFKNVGKEFIVNLASGFSGDNSAFKTVTANITKGFSNITSKLIGYFLCIGPRVLIIDILSIKRYRI